MERSSTSSSQEAQQESSLFLFVVVVGYIITFTKASIGETGCSILQLIIGIFFGMVYLSLGFFEAEILRRFSDLRNVLFFSTQLALYRVEQEGAVQYPPTLQWEFEG